MKYIRSFTVFIIFLIAGSVFADDSKAAKDSIISNLTNSIASSLENFIGGEGDTEVQITAGEEYHPEFSIMTVRPLATHPGVDAWFIQLQLNDTKIRGEERLSTNIGVGYRKLSKDKNSFTGANVFIDYDQEGNARTSVGLELRSSAFEALANYYNPISGGNTVGAYTERSLGGYEFSLVGELPYLPWASIVANHYEWQAEKNSKNSSGEKYSLELTVTPSLIVEGGFNDNNINGNTNFVKIYLTFPPRKSRIAATTNFIADTAFSNIDMSDSLLSKVKRTNKQVIESEGTGVVMARVE